MGARDPPHALANPTPYAGCGKRAGAGRERVFTLGLTVGFGGSTPISPRSSPRCGGTATDVGHGTTAGKGKAVTVGGNATVEGRTAETTSDTAVTTCPTTVPGSVTVEPVAPGSATITPVVSCTTVCVIVFATTVVACATAAIVCVTAPLSPGLAMRMEMFVFCG